MLYGRVFSYFIITVPISTLILGPTKSELEIYYSGQEGEELCEGVTYLGKPPLTFKASR